MESCFSRISKVIDICRKAGQRRRDNDASNIEYWKGIKEIREWKFRFQKPHGP